MVTYALEYLNCFHFNPELKIDQYNSLTFSSIKPCKARAVTARQL